MLDRDTQSDLIAQRYKPLFPRARGGFSDVIIAWDTRLARRVAIKKVNTGVSLPAASLEEARTAALLSSPNIVSVHDFEEGHPETLIIMENVDGPSLGELMKESTELLHLDVATTILEGIVAALEYAHENQVLHLDIKPGNILIDQSGRIKVSDFGLAELAGAGGFGEVQGGTIGYMPPEQLTGGVVDVRTDLWALAALTYQLLTGTNPFFALSFRESLSQIVLAQYALPSELRPALGGAVDEVLVKALSPEKEQRQESVAEFWSELRPHLGRIGPGRRSLKTLTRVWAGKEAALLENTEESGFEETDEYAEKIAHEELARKAPAHAGEGEDAEDPKIAIWNNIYDDSADYSSPYQEDSTPSKKHKDHSKDTARDKPKKKKEPGPPFWERLTPGGQAFFARFICALAAAGMVWLAMSSLPYLSAPLAQAASTAAANTGNPTPALLDAAFAVRFALMLITLIVAFIVPRVGAALAVAGLGLGLFFTGNWFVGILVLACCIIWYLAIGRREVADSAILTLSPLLAILSIPMLVPLLAGFFQNWRRALGTTALACFICSLLSLLTYGYFNVFFGSILGMGNMPVYGQFSGQPLGDLLSVSPQLLQMPHANQLFMPLVNLFTSVEFWFIFAGWLTASVVMSLLSGGKSRVKYTLATLLGIGIVAAGYLLPLLLFAGADSATLMAALIIRLVIAGALCLLIIALGVQSKPSMHKSKGRAK
ncbi:MAG: serine/threonine protein kinase [Coriobacteriia bacterium]|nr:serine/threonine protein kinase [Coriobacteriia bacterium]MCL2749600.1 serine/threonine protein kinase [Coriobacteriia bacterium]